MINDRNNENYIRLKDVRTSKGMTQSELAEKLCVTQQAVANWESRKTVPQADRLYDMAEVLNTPLLSLLYDDRFPKYKKLDYTAEMVRYIKELEEQLKASDTVEIRLSLLKEKEYYAEHDGKCFYWGMLTDYEYEIYQLIKGFLSVPEIVTLLNKRRSSLGNQNSLIETCRCD